MAHGIFVKCAGGLVDVHGLSSLIGIESTSPASDGEFFFFFFLFDIYLFVCFWLHWASVAVHGFFSSCGERGLLRSCGTPASHCSGFSCCRAGALGMWASAVAACGL